MILGIDPGLSGAFFLLGDAYDYQGLRAQDIPTTERVVAGKKKRQLDHASVALYMDYHRTMVSFAVLEQVNAMPGQGVTSSFNFGSTYGALLQALASAGIPVRTVVPQVWKRKFNLLGSGGVPQPKDASRAEASRRLPQYASLWQLAKHDGRAEAALLALYGQEMK